VSTYTFEELLSSYQYHEFQLALKLHSIRKQNTENEYKLQTFKTELI